MKQQHTPGPWRVSHDPAVIESDNASNHIGFVAMVLPDSSLDWNLSAEAEANARLIASAPELLEALEAFVKWSEEKPIRQSLCGGELLISARAAIAKAKGETL